MNNHPLIAMVRWPLLLFAILPSIAQGTTYYVSPTGSDLNNGLTYQTPWQTFNQAFLPTYNQPMKPGDTLIAEGGTYYPGPLTSNGLASNGLWQPTGGTAASPITIQAAPGETPIISGVAADGSQKYEGDNWGVVWSFGPSSQYIVVDGISFENMDSSTTVVIDLDNTSHVTVRNCTFKNLSPGGLGFIRFYNVATYNVVDGNTFDKMGDPAAPEDPPPPLWYGSGDSIVLLSSNHNLIENNVLSHAGHANIEVRDDDNVTGSDYNIFLNNTIDQPWAGGIYINRRSNHEVVEGNRIYGAGTGNAVYPKTGIEVAGENMVIRDNVIDVTGGIGGGAGDDGLKFAAFNDVGVFDTCRANRMYNNVVYQANEAAVYFFVQYSSVPGINTMTNNKLVNNIFYDDRTGGTLYGGSSYLAFDTWWATTPWSKFPNNQYFINNILANPALNHPTDIIDYGTHSSDVGYSVTQANAQFAPYFAGNLEANPNFVDAPNRNFSLVSGSPALGHGAHLAHTTAAGNGTVIPVDDALFFTDGYGIIGGDIIQVGSNAPVQITNVNETANTLTVASAVSFKMGDPVDLPYSGSAPTIGLLFSSSGTVPTPSKTATPVVNPNGGTFSNSVVASITDASSNALIYYTTDGTDPVVGQSTGYTSSLTFIKNTQLKTIAISPGMTASPIASANFTVNSITTHPVLSVSPGALTLVGLQGQSARATQSLQISNSGTGSLNWTAVTTPSWLSLSPTNGSLAAAHLQAATVSGNLSGLSTGTYSGSITVTAAGATNSPDTIPVTLTVVPPAAGLLQIAPNTITFSTTTGAGLVAPQLVILSNIGGATVSWDALTLNSNWLTIRPPGFGNLIAGQSTTLAVSVNPQGLGPGMYTQPIVITSLTTPLQWTWVNLIVNDVASSSGTVPTLTTTAPRSDILVYPNPWRADKSAQRQITFDHLASNATVKLFSLSGRLVKNLAADSSGTAHWDLTNNSGSLVASGIYMYLVTDNAGNKTTGKLAIIR